MDVKDILDKITKLKAQHLDASFDLEVKEKDEFVDLYVVAIELGEPAADELLLSIENPSKEDLEELAAIADGLRNLL